MADDKSVVSFSDSKSANVQRNGTAAQARSAPPRRNGHGGHAQSLNKDSKAFPSRSSEQTRQSSPRKTVSPAKTKNKNEGTVLHRGSVQSVPSTATNTLYEQVFLITTGHAVGEQLPEVCLCVPDVAKKQENKLLNSSNIEEAVFERILMSPSSFTAVSQTKDKPVNSQKNHASEPCAFKYLYHCFVRWKAEKDKCAELMDDVAKCKSVIFQNTKICLQQPEMFSNQNIPRQFVDICIDSKDMLLDTNSKMYEFFMDVVAVIEQEPKCMTECLVPILTVIRDRFLHEYKLLHAAQVSQHTSIIELFTHKASLAEVLMKFTEPSDWTVACSYEQTLLGSLLAMNPCPKDAEGPYEFFFNAVDSNPQSIHTANMFIWQRLNDICEDIHKILMSTIRLSPDLRHKVLKWLGQCIAANRGKPDLWSAHEAEVFHKEYCSDGFCLNLCHVVLQMCQPFSAPNSDKLLKVKPSYCRISVASEKDMAAKCVHARGLSREATFVPYTDDMALPEEESYHFISECFYLAHQAVHIGYSIVYKIMKLNNSILKLKKIHEEMKNLYPKRVVELVRNQLKKEICWYLNMKAAMTEYRLSKMCLQFIIATASWLVQVAMRDDVTGFLEIQLPLSSDVPKSLAYLPEFIMSNVTVFISSLEIFKGMDLLLQHRDMLDHFMNLILVFMGSPERLVNSDIRAKLSQSLEAVLPTLKDDGTYALSASGSEEKIFHEHPLISQLAEKVLNVFVSIEMTGQSVDDERKFNYRKSMHLVLQHIWRIPVHKQAVKAASGKALADINNTDPPLFLRFLNHLINDATFLLDEALDYMKQIRVMELDRDFGKWNNLSAEQMRDKETELRNLAMMGRYRNIMANHTIYTMEIIAREIRDIFCHDVMVDRIAGMLNYFLQHLVSEKQRDYKVKDRKELEFKPEQIVCDICHIYVYLGANDHFCKAVLGEKRSFSEDLFTQALIVLNKIGIDAKFVKKFEELNKKLNGLGVEQQKEEDLVAEAPDEFLDPIMGTLMMDPVVLPASKTTIDRPVIARHLLSDQRDPFTSTALSMDMVIPNTELRDRIHTWKKQHLNS